MNKICWMRNVSGVISTLFVWGFYKDYCGFLNSIPTLLGLVILPGLLGLFSFTLEMIGFYQLPKIKPFLKSLVTIDHVNSDIGKSLQKQSRRGEIKIVLLTFGLIALCLTILRLTIGERVDAFFRVLLDDFFRTAPNWLQFVALMGGALCFLSLMLYCYFKSKKSKYKQS